MKLCYGLEDDMACSETLQGMQVSEIGRLDGHIRLPFLRTGATSTFFQSKEHCAVSKKLGTIL